MILLVEVGSTAHGTGLPGGEDHDETAIVVENPGQVLGLGPGLENHMQRTQPDYRLQHAEERLAGFGKLSQLRRHGREEKSSTLDQIERFTGDVWSAETKVARCRDEIEDLRAQRDHRSAWDAEHDWPSERLRGVDSALARCASQGQSLDHAGRTHLLDRNQGPDHAGGYEIAGVEIHPPARGPDLGIDLGL